MKFRFRNALSSLATVLYIFSSSATIADTSGTTGNFSGTGGHITTGSVHIVKTADGGAVVILDSDFSFDGAPDPRVGFGRDGSYDEASDLGALQNLAGVQVYLVPASLNVDEFNEVYIWCLKFGVPLGIANLK